MRQRTPLIVLILTMVIPLLRADEPTAAVIPGESRPTATRLEEAGKRLAEKKIAEAVSLLRERRRDVRERSGPPCRRSQRPCPSARSCRAARVGPKGLVLYRNKVEPQARQWLEQGTKTSDTSLLRRAVDEAFCSRSALSALTQLGDRAFACGRFDEAEEWWQLLAPLAPIALADADADMLIYPDPPEDLAIRTRAKQVLARLFRGRHGWRDDLEAFRKRYPKASGTLAGRTGVYATILDEATAARARNRSRPISTKARIGPPSAAAPSAAGWSLPRRNCSNG